MIDFVRRRFLFLGISALLIVPGIVSLLLPGGIHPGIDFTSGSILTLHFYQPIEQNYNTAEDPEWYKTSENWPRDIPATIKAIEALESVVGRVK